jgi:outer membrane receptor for ferrienterochelin and colicins
MKMRSRQPFRSFGFALLILNLFGTAAVRPQPAATAGKLEGRVVDSATGQDLLGANVMIKGTLFGAVTNEHGAFAIHPVPSGEYEIEAMLLGYEKQILRAVLIRPGETASVLFRLRQSAIPQPAMVVTASKRKQAIEDAPTSVDVVGDRDIRTRNATTLDQVLQNTAGLGIIDGQIDLRGSTGFNWAAGSRVLLMMDGHPLINGDTGGINWDAIPIEEVERVEVVKGAGSALYGSNAMAGMVNIITRDPSPVPQTRMRMTYGFYDTPAYDSWRWTDRFLTYRLFEQNRLDFHNALAFTGVDLSHSRTAGNVGFLLTAGRKRSTGYAQNGYYDRWNAMGKIKINLSNQETLTLTANWATNRHGEALQWISQSRPLEVPSTELGNYITYAKANANATYRHAVNRSFAYTLKANWYRTNWRDYFIDNNDYALTHKIGSEIQVDYIWKNHALTAGGETIYDRASSLIYGNPETVDVAVYGEDELKIASLWTLTLGTRYDYHHVKNVYSDGEINPRLGLVFHPSAGSSVRLSAGHGFRAPSIAEVFADITVSGIRVVQNPDLKEAERAWSFEIGANQMVNLGFLADRIEVPLWLKPFRWTARQLRPAFSLDASVFASRYTNMIDVDFNPAVMAFQFMNMGRSKTQGAEIRIKGFLFDGTLSGQAGYTFLDAKDLETGKTLHYRSKHRISAGGELKLWKLTFGLDYRYASRIEEVANLYTSDQRVPMHVLDGRILMELGKLTFAVECNNIRNYHYTLRQRLLEPVRSYIFTVRSTL